jgi:hypothetical protein
VARLAYSAQSGILTARMARRADNAHVLTGEREACARVVIEGRSSPTSRGVALGAVLAKARPCMIRVAGSLVIRKMARGTLRAQRRVLIVCMALSARRGRVFSRQREARLRCVIERRGSPTRRCVAGGARLREPGRHVVWARRRLERFQMAGLARHR